VQLAALNFCLFFDPILNQMKNIERIISKYNYSITQRKEQIHITQDGTSGFFGFIFIVAGGALGWYMGKQDPELQELENDPFITESLFYKILDFIGTIIQWGFIIGAVLLGIFLFYGILEKGTYQLSIQKDALRLNSVGGNVKWEWIDITDFSIENSTESLYAIHASGQKKKLFEFYSKDKSAVRDLKEIKHILLKYKHSFVETH